MDEDLYELLWRYSEKSAFMDNFPILADLTEKLIHVYEEQGRLASNPFIPSRERSLTLPFDQIAKVLKDKVCLVTGGLGCVGSNLIQELVMFQPRLIVILDCNSTEDSKYKIIQDERIVLERCSVADFSDVSMVFETYQPHIVFHTAAQRDPGLAESTIQHSVQTNVIGTWNMLRVIQKSFSVEQFVFSSTGKASRYFTEEVYAATKKICEMLVDYYSKKCPEKYFSMVRFTHIVDNSLMDNELKSMAQFGDHVAIHSPGKFVTAQNAKEAAYLMLNGLIYAEFGRSNFLLVKNLEWPVESLEVALYYIKHYQRKIPIVFTGNPNGYGEKFFRGQLDWSSPGDMNLLINAYESRTKRLSESNDFIISSIIPYDQTKLETLIELLETTTGESETKEILIGGLKSIFVYSLSKVEKALTLQILKWGIDPKFLAADNTKVKDFGEMVPLMIDSLIDTPYADDLSMITNQKNFDLFVK